MEYDICIQESRATYNIHVCPTKKVDVVKTETTPTSSRP